MASSMFDRLDDIDPTVAVLESVGGADAAVDLFTPGLFVRSLGRAARASIAHPSNLVAPVGRLAGSALRSAGGAVALARGGEPEPVVEPRPGDRRFADPAYRDNPLLFLVQQLYLAGCQFAEDVIDAGELNDGERAKARFAARFVADALAPTNTLLGNPAALRKTKATRGRSLAKGLQNFVHDVRTNGGWPSQVDASGFEVGVNMAVTPGAVVYRGDLIEVLEYTPQTETVHEIPLLMLPPWINKFYIMDLAPGRSLVEWAVQHGHRTFAVSYRNPGPDDAELTLDDYVNRGPLEALEVVKAITKAKKVNTVSVCLGGTLTAMVLAEQARTGDRSINTATLINAHTDFSTPGTLGAFLDDDSIAAMAKRLNKKGYLEARRMALTFDALRANDLIFQYVGKNWLQGESPPAFDLLAWNNDGTNLAAGTHVQTLRSCYMRNEFARGELMINGHKLDPSKITQETYIVSAIDDHIVPWVSGYRSTQVLGGPSRFVLAGSGHIAGIVTPPGPKARHWINPETPADPEEWRAGAEFVADTWWADWAEWIVPRAGKMVPAPKKPGRGKFRSLGPAPGTYVRAKADDV